MVKDQSNLLYNLDRIFKKKNIEELLFYYPEYTSAVKLTMILIHTQLIYFSFKPNVKLTMNLLT